MKRFSSLLAVMALALVSGCGDNESDTVGVVLEHFCRYEAVDTDDEYGCFAYWLDHGLDRVVHREEWGPRAQATLYALGELKGCLSKAGARCEPATWPVVLDESLLVKRYCAYGSVSIEQLRGCLQHVSRPAVSTSRTNAGSYALGEIISCGWDSGPFCVDRRREE